MKITKVKNTFGWWLSLLVILLPLLLWLVERPIGSDLSSTAGWLLYGAKASAFVGLAGYAWSIVLSARIHGVEKAFGGLDKLYIAHNIIGGLALLLWFLHPVFITLRIWLLSGHLDRALRLWVPGTHNSLLVNLGIVAILGMAVITGFTYLVKLKHQTFVRIHRLFGLILLPAVWHGFIATGHMADNAALRRYMLVLCFLAVCAFLYYSVFGQLLKKRYKYKVKEVTRLSDSVVEVTLRRTGMPIAFTPGQFAFISFRDKDLDKEAHPYSFASGRHESDVKFVVKDLGDYTTLLPLLDVGASAYFEGPYGGFLPLNNRRKKQVWIAGGIGITPFLSAARSLRKNDKRQIDLYYCTKTAVEAHFTGELKKLARKIPGFRIIPICEATDGFLTADTILGKTKDAAERDFFICGPPVMMKSLEKQLLARGVAPNSIHLEEFAY